MALLCMEAASLPLKFVKDILRDKEIELLSQHGKAKEKVINL